MNLALLARLDCLVMALRREPTSDYRSIAELLLEALVVFAELEIPRNTSRKSWNRAVAEIMVILRRIEAGGDIQERPLSGTYDFILSFFSHYVSFQRTLLIMKNHPVKS